VSSSTTDRTQASTLVAARMPQMGVSVAEGTLTVWHKRVGDWVERDELICEVSTDKIDTDVPSPAAGRVVELLVAPEQTVPVGTALAHIATDAAPGEAHPAEHDRAPAAAPGDDSRAGFHSPVAQRLAACHGIDLAAVTGTGRGGRVRKQDVIAAARAGADTAPGRGAGSGSAGASEPRGAAAPAAPETGAVTEPLSRMRRSIAEHMTRSLRTAAHCTTIVEADFSRAASEQERIGCSPLAIVARATVQALVRHPAMNATLDGEALTRHRDVNLGIAVSLGEDGLIVPVIRRAQELSTDGIAARIGEIAARARAGALTADDVRGGTFTITNPGGFGSIASTPIINQPQVAILDLEAVVKRPVAVVDDSGADAIAIRPMAYLCLSWDHRALDGALAAQFLATLRGLIEEKEVAR
jgi:pyruvate/2-oxoglutarate dehydrogenase complex dihydrolipoamide acyltransferase (E2) component